jgi:hypothetical protein
LTRYTIIFKLFLEWFLAVFILVGMSSAFGLQSIHFTVKVTLGSKVLKNAQNGSGEAIREEVRG